MLVAGTERGISQSLYSESAYLVPARIMAMLRLT